MSPGKTLQDYQKEKKIILEYIDNSEKEKEIILEMQKFFLSSVHIEILVSNRTKGPLDIAKGAVQGSVSRLLH